MTNYREILRLSSLGINHSQIADSTAISRPTVITVLQRAAAQELDWQAAEGLNDRELKLFTKAQLLIIDEWLLYEAKDSEVRDILEVVDRRHKRGSTIFCSQYDTHPNESADSSGTPGAAGTKNCANPPSPMPSRGPRKARRLCGVD